MDKTPYRAEDYPGLWDDEPHRELRAAWRNLLCAIRDEAKADWARIAMKARAVIGR